MYSDMVIFSLPPVNAVKHRLANTLLKTLLRIEDGVWRSYKSFLGWAVFMGAMTAYATEFRAAYISLLHSMHLIAHFGSWQNAKLLLRKFLWWDFVCDMPGGEVWKESEQLHLAILSIRDQSVLNTMNDQWQVER